MKEELRKEGRKIEREVKFDINEETKGVELGNRYADVIWLVNTLRGEKG